RSMNIKHAGLLFLGVLGWTLCLGSIFAFFGPDSEIFSTEIQQVAVAYIDACISALSIANGILLFFRFKESWLVWLIASILYIIVAIITNTWILLVLYIGYLINTIYGSFCWKKYLDKKDDMQETEQPNTLQEQA
ncbi:MAG: nicotinamide mononucleotide transporter, partial [Clostridia bacterium]|nr:nicotinamide mononucleotide transporter [Clostridia bacterium]